MEEKPTRRKEAEGAGLPADPPRPEIEHVDADEDRADQHSPPLDGGCQTMLGCGTGFLILLLFGVAAGGYMWEGFLAIALLTGGTLTAHYFLKWRSFTLGVLITLGLFALLWSYCAFGLR